MVGMNLTVYARYVTMLYSGTVHLNSRGEHCTLNSGGGGTVPLKLGWGGFGCTFKFLKGGEGGGEGGQNLRVQCPHPPPPNNPQKNFEGTAEPPHPQKKLNVQCTLRGPTQPHLFGVGVGGHTEPNLPIIPIYRGG